MKLTCDSSLPALQFNFDYKLDRDPSGHFLAYKVVGNFPNNPSTCPASRLVTANCPASFFLPFSYGLLLTSNIRHYTMVLDLRHVIPSAALSSGGHQLQQGGPDVNCVGWGVQLYSLI